MIDSTRSQYVKRIDNIKLLLFLIFNFAFKMWIALYSSLNGGYLAKLPVLYLCLIVLGRRLNLRMFSFLILF